ncbi:unnamed protein product [Orchesella dallaii]|uniref:Uncharacterized protein n=1 Tax=Orchesella dallaii TaxID=48710 RepID=A0ABP1RIZ9_9HEXA
MAPNNRFEGPTYASEISMSDTNDSNDDNDSNVSNMSAPRFLGSALNDLSLNQGDTTTPPVFLDNAPIFQNVVSVSGTPVYFPTPGSMQVQRPIATTSTGSSMPSVSTFNSAGWGRVGPTAPTSTGSGMPRVSTFNSGGWDSVGPTVPTSTGSGMPSASTFNSTGWGRAIPIAPTLIRFGAPSASTFNSTGFRMVSPSGLPSTGYAMPSPSTPNSFGYRLPTPSTGGLFPEPVTTTYCILCPSKVVYPANEEEPKSKTSRRAGWVYHLTLLMNRMKVATMPDPDYCTPANFPLCTPCETKLQRLVDLANSQDRLMEQWTSLKRQSDEVVAILKERAGLLNLVKQGKIILPFGRVTPMGYTEFTDMVAEGVINQAASNNSTQHNTAAQQPSNVTHFRENQPGPSFFNGGTSTTNHGEMGGAPVHQATATAIVNPYLSTATLPVNVEQGAAAAPAPLQNNRPSQADGATGEGINEGINPEREESTTSGAGAEETGSQGILIELLRNMQNQRF